MPCPCSSHPSPSSASPSSSATSYPTSLRLTHTLLTPPTLPTLTPSSTTLHTAPPHTLTSDTPVDHPHHRLHYTPHLYTAHHPQHASRGVHPIVTLSSMEREPEKAHPFSSHHSTSSFGMSLLHHTLPLPLPPQPGRHCVPRAHTVAGSRWRCPPTQSAHACMHQLTGHTYHT